MSEIVYRRFAGPPGRGLKLLAVLIMAMGGVAWADTIIIPAGGSVNLSTIYGTGVGQTQSLSDLVFNGTSSSPATLMVDHNSAQGSNSWVFDSVNSAANRILLGSNQNATIRVQDGINLTIRGTNSGVIRGADSTSKISFDVGNGSTLRFENNNAASSTTPGVIYSASDVVFRGEGGSVVFDSNIAIGYAAGIRADNANVVFEGNATFTNNQSTQISGAVIRTFSSGDIVFTGQNSMITIANNIALNSGGGLFSDGAVKFYGNADIYGNRGINDTAGAIVAQSGLTMVTNGTSGIKVHDNYSNTQSAGAILIGNAAVTGSSLIYAKNSDIQFYNNRTQTGNGPTPNLTNAVANAINIRQSNGLVSIAADAGRQVLFKDPITSFNASNAPVYTTIGINTTTGSDHTDGTVTFTGEDFTAGSLSTQSRVYGSTTVYGGVLELKDNAQYGVNASGTSFTLKDGATLLSTGVAANATNVLAAQTMNFANGSTIRSHGNSTLNLTATNRLIGSVATDTVFIDTVGTDQLTLNGILTGSGKLQKTGVGTLLAGNVNQFANGGGFNLTAGSLNAQNLAQQFTSLDVQSGALLAMGSTGTDLTITDRGMIAGSLSNVQTLYKYGSGDLHIANSVGANQLEMYGGTLKIDSGKTFSIVNSATLGSGVAAQMDIASHPALSADTLTLAGGNALDISGYAPRTDGNTYTLVSTQNGISGDFSYTVAGHALQDYVDLDIFLVGWAKKDAAAKNIIAELGLVWNNTEDNSAHGTFNVASDNSFNLNAALADNPQATAHGFGWDGRSLTKTGDGLLALSAVNTYTGSTTVNAGTLRTDIANTLNSSSDVVVNGGILDLNGNSQQANRLSGTGGEIRLNGATLTTANATAADNTHFDGDIVDGTTGGGRFIKAGDGGLTLAGQTGWSGGTWLNAGELILDGANGGAQLTSNIIGTSGTRLKLQNGAVLTGWIDPTDVGIDAASRWNMTANSVVDNLNNAGAIHIAAPAANGFKTLTVQGNYTGNNGLFVLNTRLGSDDSPTDRLIVQGDTAGGTRLQIVNAGGTGAQTLANGIEVIRLAGQSNGSFTLASPVVAGVYEYQLFQGDANAQGGNWYLRSHGGARAETGVYLRNLSAASTMFLHTLHDRLGELQNTDNYRSAGSNAPVGWVRITGNRTDSRAADGRIDVDTDTALLHFGGDVARWSNNGNDRWHLGLMGAYGRSDVDASPRGDGRSASGKVDGYSVGAYATWFGNVADKPVGSYIDAWAQYAWYDNQVKGKGLPGERYDSDGWTVSIEGGYALIAADGEERQWMIEPQVQLAYNNYRADDHRETNGTRVRSGDIDGVTSRLGVRMYSRSKVGNSIQPFVEANWWYGDAKNSLSFDGVIVSDDIPRNRYEMKAGLQGEMAKGWQAWGHIGGQWGENSYKRYEGMVGVRKTF